MTMMLTSSSSSPASTCTPGRSKRLLLPPTAHAEALRNAAKSAKHSPFFDSGKFDEEWLYYIGRVHSSNSRTLEVAFLETTWGEACRVTRRLLLFDASGKYLGSYGDAPSRPTIDRHSIVFPVPESEGNRIDLHAGIPAEVRVGGELLAFEGAE
jgi:hypothetical protein